MKIDRYPYLLLIIAAFLWSGNFIVGRAVHDDIPPVALAFFRWLVATVLIFPLARDHLRRDWPRLTGHWPILLLLSIIGVAAFNTLVYAGLHWTQAINAFLMQSMMPVLIVALSFVLFRERITARQLGGVVLSLAGAGTIILRGDWSGLASLTVNRGDLLVLLAVICYAGYSVLLHKRPPIHPLSFVTVTFAIGSLILLPFFAWETVAGPGLQFSPAAVMAIIYVAIFPSIVSYLCFNRGVELVGANRAGLFIHLMPVFGSLMAILFLGESFHGFHAFGLALIFSGIFFATRHQ